MHDGEAPAPPAPFDYQSLARTLRGPACVPSRTGIACPEEWMPWIDGLGTWEGRSRTVQALRDLSEGADARPGDKLLRRVHLIAQWLLLKVGSPAACGIYMQYVARGIGYQPPEARHEWACRVIVEASAFFETGAREKAKRDWHAFAWTPQFVETEP